MNNERELVTVAVHGNNTLRTPSRKENMSQNDNSYLSSIESVRHNIQTAIAASEADTTYLKSLLREADTEIEKAKKRG